MDGREQQIELKRFVGPQYSMEPPYIEGTFEKSHVQRYLWHVEAPMKGHTLQNRYPMLHSNITGVSCNPTTGFPH